jgi:hypothetical protein
MKTNECDACHEPTEADVGAFCGGDHCPEVEAYWTRWFDRHDDIYGDD